MMEASTNLSCVCNSQTVKRSNSNMDDLFAPQSLHHLGLAHMDISAVAKSEVVAFAPVWKRKKWPLVRGKKDKWWLITYSRCIARPSYQVHTTPDLVRAKENCAPHSIWQTPCPLSLSMFWGMLQPSLPPRPSFPKSPSPQENTNPDENKHKLPTRNQNTCIEC